MTLSKHRQTDPTVITILRLSKVPQKNEGEEFTTQVFNQAVRINGNGFHRVHDLALIYSSIQHRKKVILSR